MDIGAIAKFFNPGPEAGMTKTILIVDDDPTQRRLLELALDGREYRTLCAESGEEALKILKGPDALDIDLVLQDIAMPDISGIDIVETMHALRPSLPFVMLTAHGSVRLVVKAMRAGSSDFIVKPASPERLKVSIENALKLNALTGELSRVKRRKSGTLKFGDIIGKSAALDDAIKLAQRAATTNVPVLIEGESGVGKELFARAIQGSSDRARKPMVVVNCGALPENLVESILFGHEKGAFTGAVERHRGKFQDADTGTLFLDEVGELSLEMQVKLLRALQEQEIEPVGGGTTIKVDVRVISATNRSLEEMVAAGKFREDLFYRLNVFPVVVPPLRDRPEDVPALIEHFVTRISASEDRTVSGVAPDTLTLLKNFAWPGNVRQLENAIFRAVVLCDREILSNPDFPQITQAKEPKAAPANDTTTKQIKPVAGPEVRSNIQSARPSDGGGAIAMLTESGEMRQIRDIEAEVIEYAIQKYQGRMSEIARRLGIGRSTLYRKMNDIGLSGETGAS